MKRLDEVKPKEGPIYKSAKRFLNPYSIKTSETTLPVTAFQSNNYPGAARFLNEVWTDNPIPKISPEDAAKVAMLESSMDTYAGSKYRGYGQVGNKEYASYYGTDSAKVVMNQYANKTRSLRDAAMDFNTHLRKMSERVKADKLTFGRIMVNQFAPYSNLNDVVSDIVWNNNVQYMIDNGRLPNTLVKGKTTYRELMEAFDNSYKSK